MHAGCVFRTGGKGRRRGVLREHFQGGGRLSLSLPPQQQKAKEEEEKEEEKGTENGRSNKRSLVPEFREYHRGGSANPLLLLHLTFPF